MSTGRQLCPDCLATVFRVRVIDGNNVFKLELDLEPEPVRGGRFVIWSPNGGRTWVARQRPVTVSPPSSMTGADRARWDGQREANERFWHVKHHCWPR